MTGSQPAPGRRADPGGRGPGGRVPWWLRAGLVGLTAGLMSGLFGVGGGIVMVPMFVAWFALDQRRASATSLLAIIPIAAASATGYAVHGNVDPAAALLLVVGGTVGGTIGARLLPRVPIPRLQFWFGILSLLTAVRLFVEDPATSGSGVVSMVDAVLLLLVGALAGVLAGLLGVGGGIIMVPGLVLLAGDDASTARGTSLMVVVLTALSATVTNLRNRLVEVRIALVAGLCGVPGGLVGAAVGQWLPETVALGLFSVLLAWSGLTMLRRARRARTASHAGPADPQEPDGQGGQRSS